LAAGRASVPQEPDRHWISRNGVDWRSMEADARRAYVEGFLAGATLVQGSGQARDSAGLFQQMVELRRSGKLRFPFGANVYESRISDYYWWENHRQLPTWYAFWEVNTSLTRSSADSAR
jgi:hypothetical protein